MGDKEKEDRKAKKEKEERKEKEEKKEKKEKADTVVVEADDDEELPQSRNFKKGLAGFAKLTAPIIKDTKPPISKDDLPVFNKDLDATNDQDGPPKCPEGHLLKPW